MLKTEYEGLVEKVEDNIARLDHLDVRERDIVSLSIKTEEWGGAVQIVKFPRRLSQQEKNMIEGKKIKYTATMDFWHGIPSREYELQILDEPYKNWKLKVIP